MGSGDGLDGGVDQLVHGLGILREELPVLVHEVPEVLVCVLTPGVLGQQLVEIGEHLRDRLAVLLRGALQGLLHAGEALIQHLAAELVLDLLIGLPGLLRGPVVVRQLGHGRGRGRRQCTELHLPQLPVRGIHAGVTQQLLALQPQPHRIEAQHAVDAEVAAHPAQEADVLERVQPFGIVGDDRAFKVDEAGEHARQRGPVGRDRLCGHELAALVLAGRVAHLAGAAAQKHDRPVAQLLHPPQHHDGDQMAHMERRAGQIIADVAGDRAGGGKRVELALGGDLVDVAPLVEQCQKFGTHGALR